MGVVPAKAFEGFREAWAPPRAEAIYDWAERSLVFPREITSQPGPLRLGGAPYARPLFGYAKDVHTRELTLCFSTQVLKTTFQIVSAFHNMSEAPSNVAFIAPKKDLAESVNVDRFQPILRASPELSRFLTGEKRQTTRDMLRFNGVNMFFGGAQSATDLASRSVRMMLLDEVDKFPKWTGSEADPVRLARERMRTYPNSLLIDASTPTTRERYIWERLERGTNERFHVPCPHCSFFQEFRLGERKGPGLKWEAADDLEDILDRNLAWYECERCAGRIEEPQRRSMVRKGLWCPEGASVSDSGTLIGDLPERPRHRSAHISAFYSPFLTFSEIAYEFLISKSNPRALQNFRNSWLAVPWENKLGGITRKDLLERCRDPATRSLDKRLPNDARILTAGVDVQRTAGQTYHYYVLRAWAMDGRSWLFRHGRTSGWTELEAILMERGRYKCADGREAQVFYPVIDSGYSTSEVYRWVAATGGQAFAYKGDVRGRKHLNVQDLPVQSGAGEIKLATVNPDYFKTELHRLILGGDFKIPSDVEDEYLDHLVSEQPHIEYDRDGRQRERWKVEREGTPNHFLDCEVMALVAADIAHIRQGSPECPVKDASDDQSDQ